nr:MULTISPECIES: hypothetical protein [Rhizobium]
MTHASARGIDHLGILNMELRNGEQVMVAAVVEVHVGYNNIFDTANVQAEHF